jgi:thiosulfate/3-mercaptopyruvate sulfurtransferase
MSNATTARWQTLVDPQALAARLGDADLRLFDCRFALNDTAAGEAAWRAARLPGARYAHLDRDLSGAHAPDAGRHPWPDAPAFAAWCVGNGIGTDTQVVAYDAGDGAFAARLWWLLRALGHRDVAVLDGGWAQWNALGLPVDEDPPAQAASAAAPWPAPAFDRDSLLDAGAVTDALSAGDLLIDARAAERFRGEVEPIDRVAGHVPGAINRPYAANLRDGRFKPAAELAAEFSALLGDRPPQRAIAMCGSGVTACHHLLAMAHAGLPGARLFTGSWSGWIEDPQRPIATGDA